MSGFDGMTVSQLEGRAAQLAGEMQELLYRMGEVDGIAMRDIEAAIHDKEECMLLMRAEIARRDAEAASDDVGTQLNNLYGQVSVRKDDKKVAHGILSHGLAGTFAVGSYGFKLDEVVYVDGNRIYLRTLPRFSAAIEVDDKIDDNVYVGEVIVIDTELYDANAVMTFGRGAHLCPSCGDVSDDVSTMAADGEFSAVHWCKCGFLWVVDKDGNDIPLFDFVGHAKL